LSPPILVVICAPDGLRVSSSLEWYGANRLSLALLTIFKVFRGHTVVQANIAE